MQIPETVRSLVLPLLAGLLGACATQPVEPVPNRSPVAEVVVETPLAPTPPRLGVFLVATGRRGRGPLRGIVRNGLRDALTAADLVYVGEAHDDPDHHALQVEVLAALHDLSGGKAMLGMEMFQRPYQEHLDAYVAGQIDELEMLRRTEYFDRWAFDHTLYAPLWRLCRDKGIPVVALNISRDLTRPVGRGGLDSLTPEQRAQLPEDVDFSVESHRRRILDVFTGGAHKMPSAQLENLYQAMTVWDEVMGESAALRMAAAPEGTKMLVVAGLHHIQGRTGIPARVAKRLPDREHLVILARTAGAPGGTGGKMSDDLGDAFVVFTSAAAKLGVMLEPVEDGGLKVTAVSPGGTAAAAGLREGDVLVGIGSRTVTDMTDLRYALDKALVGERMLLVVTRDGKRTTVNARLLPAPARRPSP